MENLPESQDSNYTSIPPDLQERDVMLEVLVEVANKGVMSLGITLNIPGGLVTGTLIGGRGWFDQLTTELSQQELPGRQWG